MPEIEELPTVTFSPQLREGMRHHAAGRLADAADCYRQAHQDRPDDADALLLLGIVARQCREFSSALRLLTLAKERRPQAAHIQLNLALTHLNAGHLDAAAASCRQALDLDPRNGRAWFCMGEIESRRGHAQAALEAFELALELPSYAAGAALAIGNQMAREQRYEEAMRLYARGLASEPRHAELFFALGAAAAAAGKMREARRAYRKALEHRPDFPEAHLNLGNLLYDGRNFLAAAASYSRALALRPGYAKAHTNLGNALSALGSYDRAVQSYQRAIALNPEAVAAHHNLGNALLHRREYARAEACFRQALRLGPGAAEHHNSLGNALLQQCRSREAEACYREALARKPDYAAAHINLANTLLQLGRPDEMKEHYQRGVALAPGSAGAQYNLGLVCLRQGKYAEGWRRHEWRWDFHELHQQRRNFSQPQWRGEALNGAAILLHAEQGLGDTLQFLRYVPLVAARGGRVLLEVQPRMARLLQPVAGVEQVLTRGERLPPFDWHCPFMSLPRAFRTTVETIPAAAPYLRADSDAVAAAWKRFPRRPGWLRIGLAWSGNPSYKSDAQRSIPLHRLAALAGVPNAVFYSLQYGAAARQIAGAPSSFPVIDACSQDKDLADTAAIAATLDLILSVDTSIAHLAGAMGLPLWVMLAHLADWRWLEERTDSPWYPTARLFRQPAPGQWEPVIASLRSALMDFVPEPGSEKMRRIISG